MGTSKDAFPFAYKDKNGRVTEYSICKLIKLSRFTGIPILEVIGCFDLEDDAAKESEESATLK